MTQLIASLRNNKTTAALRAEGVLPAVIYGKGIESFSVALDKEAFKKSFKEAGSSTAVHIEIDGKKFDCLIQEIQRDPSSHEIIHADLMVLAKDRKVTVTVELEFEGIAPAVKSGLGNLEKMLYEIEVEALPKDLPKSLMVDLGLLIEAGSQIHASDIALPSGVTLITNPEEVIAVITDIKEETEESGSIDFANIEVVKKGKKDEESAE